MKEKVELALRGKVRGDYNAIAEDFSKTRDKLWPELYFFQKFIKIGDKILDIGCGNGRLYDLFSGLSIEVNYVGVDNAEEFVVEAKKRYAGIGGKVQFLSADILDLPFLENEFDAVFSIAMLQHLPGKEARLRALRNVKKVLKPGGYFLMSNWNLYQGKYLPLSIKYILKKVFTPNSEFAADVMNKEVDFGDMLIPWKSEGINRYYHAFRRCELKNLLEIAGFKIIFNDFSKNTGIKGISHKNNIITVAQNEF